MEEEESFVERVLEGKEGVSLREILILTVDLMTLFGAMDDVQFETLKEGTTITLQEFAKMKTTASEEKKAVDEIRVVMLETMDEIRNQSLLLKEYL